MLTEIGHVVLRTRDLAACRKLYGTELGLEEIAYGRSSDGREVAMFRLGPSILELEEDPSAPIRTYEPSNLRPKVGHFAFLVESTEKLSATFKERGFAHKGPSVQPIEHSYLQRSLVEFPDPSGFMIQVAEVVDMRTKARRAIRRAVKQAMFSLAGSGVMFCGFDHMNMACTDTRAAREFYAQKLGLQELVHRVVDDAEERDFAIGCTDLEIWSKPGWDVREAGAVRSLGFWTDDVEQACRVLKDRGIELEGPPSERAPFPHIRRIAFTFRDPDGFLLQVAQRL